jgi:hypothetical protein
MMRSSWNPATSWHLLLAARRHHRQVVGADVDTDSNEHSDKAEPESPVMMRAPPVRSLTMAMMTLAVRMRVFGVVHGHADLREKYSYLRKNVTMSDPFTVLSESGFPRLEPAPFSGPSLG